LEDDLLIGRWPRCKPVCETDIAVGTGFLPVSLSRGEGDSTLPSSQQSQTASHLDFHLDDQLVMSTNWPDVGHAEYLENNYVPLEGVDSEINAASFDFVPAINSPGSMLHNMVSLDSSERPPLQVCTDAI
jgi:hypothetical protein